MIKSPNLDLPVGITGGSDAFDDLIILQDEFFAQAVTGTILKRWNGSTWISVTIKRWSGSVWVDSVLKIKKASGWQ